MRLFCPLGEVMKQVVIGILAHVDAGKTTLSEGLLYLCGQIRKMGRVDHGDAFLDTYELEKERGITIFSKQAILDMPDMRITLLDTPGHVDFSSEMERTLQVLDYAVLVISGADGIQGHSLTLWRLLERYQIPTFLFVNKMDQEGTDKEALLKELKNRFSQECIDFTFENDNDQDRREGFFEEIALCDEAVMEEYLADGCISEERITSLLRQRMLFPCCFGSALKMTGVQEFLEVIRRYTEQKTYPEAFGARVFKISRDDQGNRLTYLKVTGGRLKVKGLIRGETDGEAWEEKADQLRLYSGTKYRLMEEAAAGSITAVTGLTHTFPGEGLGAEPDAPLPVLEPVISCRIILPPDCDVHQMLLKLRELEEEDPQLHIVWQEQLEEIHAMLMGDVQTEILKSLIWERFHVAVDFGPGNIVYKETIAGPVIGVGHFEPLRHYAEVHLLLEPGERGSGLTFYTALSEDVLDKNWQRLILTHLMETEHPGVLTGSPITDIQITLINGRAHIKHTEGGDFRQATYRAVRNGLRKAETILLEPWYEFRLELPSRFAGRAMTDLQRMHGTFSTEVQNFPGQNADEDTTILTGSAPVSAMRDYPGEVLSYTGGRGRLFCSLAGYAPCQDQEVIAASIGYDPERDTEHPTGSVFCAHGAGFIVPWNEVENYMHLQDRIQLPADEENAGHDGSGAEIRTAAGPQRDSYAQEKELREIFERTFGPVRTRLNADREMDFGKSVSYNSEETFYRGKERRQDQEEYLLVDGYNMIFAWPDLKELAAVDIHAAQRKLMDILSNYQGMAGCILILVFDAYRVEGHAEEVVRYHNIDVVYTKEAETADMYIEKTAHRLGRKHRVTVATSDGMEQIIILGQGAARLSAAGLRQAVDELASQTREQISARHTHSRNLLIDQVGPEAAQWLKEMRLKQ